jgi:hypothetical protein
MRNRTSLETLSVIGEFAQRGLEVIRRTTSTLGSNTVVAQDLVERYTNKAHRILDGCDIEAVLETLPESADRETVRRIYEQRDDLQATTQDALPILEDLSELEDAVLPQLPRVFGTYTLGERLGEGRNAVVHEIAQNPENVLKIYTQRNTAYTPSPGEDVHVSQNIDLYHDREARRFVVSQELLPEHVGFVKVRGYGTALHGDQQSIVQVIERAQGKPTHPDIDTTDWQRNRAERYSEWSRRNAVYADAPQGHYDAFAATNASLRLHDIHPDPKQGNLFYDSHSGFTWVDIDTTVSRTTPLPPTHPVKSITGIQAAKHFSDKVSLRDRENLSEIVRKYSAAARRSFDAASHYAEINTVYRE